jgi:hypothetical protein
MIAAERLAQAAVIAYAAGLNLYATIGILGLSSRFGLVGPLPGALEGVTSWWVIGTALSLALIELVASLIPVVAAAWDTVHSFIRPPAGAALAIATAWHADPSMILMAGLLGGGLALTTHATKLGLRYAVDASPEPVSNGLLSTGELGFVAMVVTLVWQHPYATLILSLAVLAGLLLLVRMIWRTLRRAFPGGRRSRRTSSR